MLSLFDKKKSPPRRIPEVERLACAAERARAEGRIDEAVQLYRDALELAPLSRPLRADFAEALLARAEARRKPRRPENSTAILRDSLDEVEAPRPAPRPRPRTPRREPDGMAATDEKEVRQGKSRETIRKMVGELERRTEQVRAPRAPRSPAKRHFNRRKVVLAAALYGGISLVVAGVAHGLISAALKPAALPEVPVVQTLPEALTARLDEATKALTAGEPEKAIAKLETLAADFPDYAPLADAALARALRAQGNRQLDRQEYDKAAVTFERATRTDPLNPDNWIELARSQREYGRRLQAGGSAKGMEQLKRALGAYERALDLAPDHTSALVGIAQVYVFMNEREKAVQKYERVVDLSPESAEAALARQHLAQLTGRS
ncbi:MAG: Anaphase-promoting complex, cyclosome, subunit 3 [Candidatus Sumerlaeota bacterium]|nr:Anaphase-promoting complex, cyclosome, subunit 3 [Candidatus Sumerlaeota bacterium]